MAINKLTEADLLALGSLFEEAVNIADPDGFDPLPDGEYLSQVVQLEITRTKESQKLMAAWRFKVLEGEEGGGRFIFKNSILTDNPKNMKRLINDVNKFGLEVISLEDLVTKLEELQDEFCLVILKTDGQGRQWVTLDVAEV